MSYTKEDLKTKLLEMYPEIQTFGLSLSLELDKGKDAWVVSFEKGGTGAMPFLIGKMLTPASGAMSASTSGCSLRSTSRIWNCSSPKIVRLLMDGEQVGTISSSGRVFRKP